MNVTPVKPEIDKWKLFELLNYKTHHPSVRQFHNSTAQTKVCCAPARTTKSYSASYDMIADILIPETVNWIVGPSYTLAEKEFRYIHEALVIKGKDLGLPRPRVCLTNPRSGQLYIKFPWGSVVEGKTADRPDSLLGEKVDCVIYSEAAQLPRGIRERYVRPRLITKGGREIIPTTPDAKGQWVHELYETGIRGDFEEIESFTWDRTANPTYKTKEFLWAKKFYGENSPVFREQYLGEWVFYGGLVYPAFNPDLHVIEPFKIPKHWRVIRGIDFGHRDPFVTLWGAVGPNSEIYIFQELYNVEGRETKENATRIKTLSEGYNISRTVSDPSEKQLIEDLAMYGVGSEGANNDKLSGRLQVTAYLTPTDEGHPPYKTEDYTLQKWPMVYIFNTCKETIRELKYYRWKEGKSIENDKEKTEGDDHSMDVLRYILMTRPTPYREKYRLPTGSFGAIMNQVRRKRLSEGRYIR